MNGKSVAVIGGGLAGLSGAIHLANLGFRVQLFEKNITLGGKMNEVTHDGFRFDTGPSLLTMPFIIDELFETAGERRTDHLDFVPVDPVCRYFFPDGTVFDSRAHAETMQEEIERLFPGQWDAYRGFMDYGRKIFETAAEVFLFTPLHEKKKLLKPAVLKKLLHVNRIDALRTVHQSVSRYFSDHRLVQLFDRYATYNGSNPFSAPATLNIIPFVELGLGGYYIKKGMYRLVEELGRLAFQSGVELHTGTRVEKIRYLNGRVSGITVDEKFIPADYVLSGADVVETFRNLIDNAPKQVKRMEALEPSLSGMVFLWGMGRRFPQLEHHNILFSNDYREEFTQIFDEKCAPGDPTVYISITSKTDPSHAPAGSENWFILLNMPYMNGMQNWEAEKVRMKEKVISKLSAHGIEAAPYIRYEKIFTPENFQNLYASNRGSIYGISSNSRITAFSRQANRSRFVEGLYFAGGSAHPGGGIPLVIQSGKMAAELIAEREGIEVQKTDYYQKYLMHYLNHLDSEMERRTMKEYKTKKKLRENKI